MFIVYPLTKHVTYEQCVWEWEDFTLLCTHWAPRNNKEFGLGCELAKKIQKIQPHLT
jgi:hypothetical protein